MSALGLYGCCVSCLLLRLYVGCVLGLGLGSLACKCCFGFVVLRLLGCFGFVWWLRLRFVWFLVCCGAVCLSVAWCVCFRFGCVALLACTVGGFGGCGVLTFAGRFLTLCWWPVWIWWLYGFVWVVLVWFLVWVSVVGWLWLDYCCG